jgi:ATP-binding cassette subfamily B protein
MVSVSLAAIALVITPALLFLTWAYRRRLRGRWREVKRLESSAMSVVQEVLSSVRLVKAFGQEDREEDRFADRSRLGMNARIRVGLVDGTFELVLELVVAVGTAAVLYVGIRGVESGAMTLGSLLLVMGYLVQLYDPLAAISSRVTRLQSAFASAERAFTVLDEAPDVPERPDARKIGRARGEIEFRDVWFGYDSERPVLQDVSFLIEPGDRVGIAGPTGAGKTTLANLITRFYDPTDGAVLLDGIDLRDYKVADLRNQFAIVLQEPVLFSTTIAENIAYARPDATIEELVEAACAASVHDFISSLPEGYDTLVGERGMTLSGGERQRISLARAFLKDAPILILDEPTSSVDVKTEAIIDDAMKRLMDGRTAFMIAHRLSTLDMCNVRLELENGSLAEPGETSEHSSTPTARRLRWARQRSRVTEAEAS